MLYLLVVSLMWAFSFGLIGNALAEVDTYFVASFRLLCALLLLLPCLRIQEIPKSDWLMLLGRGAIQFGLMYVCYIKAFQYLPSHLVALFTILTPLYVVLIHNFRTKQLSIAALAAAALSVLGAAILKAHSDAFESWWIGFALLQVSGVAFAYGQVTYREWKMRYRYVSDLQVFALLYAGGFVFAAIVSFALTDWAQLPQTSDQWQALIYLGFVASGLGFFLWNMGAARSQPAVLAACNNAVVPLAMLCSLFIFGEATAQAAGDWLRLLIGTACIAAAVLLAQRQVLAR
jgi:drug/metabolite transporter (DMT)-like permease